MLPKPTLHVTGAARKLCESKSVTRVPGDAIYLQTVGTPPTVSDCIDNPTRL